LPSEAARFARPVGARDRRFFAALALLAAAGAGTGAFFVGQGSGDTGTASCLTYDAAGVLGGGTWHLCGSDAAAFCRAHRSESSTLAAKCEQLGL
jgi:hypothetical protein